MDTTPSEARVVRLLQQRRVARFVDLANISDLSLKTVHRALTKVGYHTSINANSAYVALRHVPQFDARGLWLHQQICFSRYGSLRATIRALIEQAPDGCSVEELQSLLRTRVHNHLSMLLGAGEIGRFHLGRHTVYTAPQRTVQQKQQACRQERQLAALMPVRTVPAGIDAVAVIHLLIQLLRTPQARPAALSASLQTHGIQMDAEHVSQVLAFYSLKKTRRGRSSN
jgi:hypothetical protein